MSNPQHIQALREEIAEAVQDGWTKEALESMWLVDSFFKESLRVNSLSYCTSLLPCPDFPTGIDQHVAAVSLTRRAVQDVKLSNGVVIPSGTLITADARDTHLNEEAYPSANTFDPYRFYKMRKTGDSAQNQFVQTSVDYVPFGVGAHAWWVRA